MPSITQSPLHLQFTKLLIEPLSSLSESMTRTAPIVVVLDALDECGNAQNRRDLLAILAVQSVHLPSFIRIIITSRAEFDIRAALMGRLHITIQELDITSDHNVRDISSFLRHRMTEIRSENTSLMLDPDWPGEVSLYALAQRAAGLFAWASTACRFIEGHDPRQRLHMLLRGSVHDNAESALNTLYQTALESVGMSHDSAFCEDFRVIMGTVLVAKNPISDSTIDALLSLKRPSRDTISRLGCVISWSNTRPMIRILHPSFADFLSDPLRCCSALWYINTSLHNRSFSVHCVDFLDAKLKRNICNLKLSPTPVNEVLPEATSYACISWIDHILNIADGAEAIADVLEQFLFRHLLHWLEAMSILKKSRTTVASVRCLLDWLKVCRLFSLSMQC
jgi:hypothetical protein